MTPPVLVRLLKLGVAVKIETGAGVDAGFVDAAYAGAAIAPTTVAAIDGANIVLAVNAPPLAAIAAMKPGAILISFAPSAQHPDLFAALRDGHVSALAMERVPRISRAQAMDALSSQAALTGYYAPLLGAVHLPRILPMMTTAVGSLRAATVLVMGLGVAGLQALATAHRLGAITEGYDVRPETAEQARSLAAKFVETGVDARGEGGYARPLTPDEQTLVETTLTRHIAAADMIITTAAVPGRAAPRLITAAQRDGMKPGSVIVDLAGAGGGNVEGTVPGETVTIGPVTILAPLDVPSRLADHASELYARNLLALLPLILTDGAVALDIAEEIVAAMLIVHDGLILDPVLRASLEGNAA